MADRQIHMKADMRPITSSRTLAECFGSQEEHGYEESNIVKRARKRFEGCSIEELGRRVPPAER